MIRWDPAGEHISRTARTARPLCSPQRVIASRALLVSFAS